MLLELQVAVASKTRKLRGSRSTETLCFRVWNIEINASAFAAHNIYEYDGYRNVGWYCFVFYDTEDRFFYWVIKGKYYPRKVEFNRENHFPRYAKLYVQRSVLTDNLICAWSCLLFFLFTVHNSEILKSPCVSARMDGNIREKKNNGRGVVRYT